ncbi:hypothetical protein ACEWY4_011055 [Coilia grayii]|uniref:Uncharacterized protein n=1 Tax=Coilia grayii TaxID=363190 RepID=A0ABD1K3P1_9TELE
MYPCTKTIEEVEEQQTKTYDQNEAPVKQLCYLQGWKYMQNTTRGKSLRQACKKMNKLRYLSVLISQRLTLAAQEIFKDVEETILELHEETKLVKLENTKLKLKLRESGINPCDESRAPVIRPTSIQNCGDPRSGVVTEDSPTAASVKEELDALAENGSGPEDKEQMAMSPESVAVRIKMETNFTDCTSPEQQKDHIPHSDSSGTQNDARVVANPDDALSWSALEPCEPEVFPCVARTWSIRESSSTQAGTQGSVATQVTERSCSQSGDCPSGDNNDHGCDDVDDMGDGEHRGNGYNLNPEPENVDETPFKPQMSKERPYTRRQAARCGNTGQQNGNEESPLGKESFSKNVTQLVKRPRGRPRKNPPTSIPASALNDLKPGTHSSHSWLRSGNKKTVITGKLRGRTRKGPFTNTKKVIQIDGRNSPVERPTRRSTRLQISETKPDEVNLENGKNTPGQRSNPTRVKPNEAKLDSVNLKNGQKKTVQLSNLTVRTGRPRGRPRKNPQSTTDKPSEVGHVHSVSSETPLKPGQVEFKHKSSVSEKPPFTSGEVELEHNSSISEEAPYSTGEVEFQHEKSISKDPHFSAGGIHLEHKNNLELEEPLISEGYKDLSRPSRKSETLRKQSENSTIQTVDRDQQDSASVDEASSGSGRDFSVLESPTTRQVKRCLSPSSDFEIERKREDDSTEDKSNCEDCPTNERPRKHQRICAGLERDQSSLCEVKQSPKNFLEVLTGMYEDDVAEAVRGDKLVLKLGQHLFDRKHTCEYIWQKLCELGRLLLSGRKITPLKKMEDYIRLSNWDHMAVAVKDVAGYCESTQTFAISQYAVSLRGSFHSIAEIIKHDANTTGDKETVQNAEKFLDCLMNKWYQEFSAPGKSSSNSSSSVVADEPQEGSDGKNRASSPRDDIERHGGVGHDKDANSDLENNDDHDHGGNVGGIEDDSQCSDRDGQDNVAPSHVLENKTDNVTNESLNRSCDSTQNDTAAKPLLQPELKPQTVATAEVTSSPVKGHQESGSMTIPNKSDAFMSSLMSRRLKDCPFVKEEDRPMLQKRQKSFNIKSLYGTIEPPPDHVSKDLWKILEKMHQDEITLAAKGDKHALQLGEQLLNKGPGDAAVREDYIRQRLRELGRLLVTCQRITPMNSLMDLILPKNWDHLIAVLKEVAGYDDETGCFTNLTILSQLYGSLQKIGSFVESDAVSQQDEEMTGNARSFNKDFVEKWRKLFPTPYSTRKSQHCHKIGVKLLPFTEDIKNLHTYLKDHVGECLSALCASPNQTVWANLAKIVLAQLIMFNRRKAREVAQLTLKEFNTREAYGIPDGAAEDLTPFERELCKYTSKTEILRATGDNVQLLIPPSLANIMETMLHKRLLCDIRYDNIFMFAQPKSRTHYSGVESLESFAKDCGAKHVKKLVSCGLREHVAVISQLLYLKDMHQVTDFMGLSLATHLRNDCAQQEILELARLGKFLTGMGKRQSRPTEQNVQETVVSADEIVQQTEWSSAEDDDDDEDYHPSRSDKSQQSPVKKRRSVTKHKWMESEVQAVERHLLKYIKARKIPGKKACTACIMAEPEALKARAWHTVKFYIRNRITVLQKHTQ